MRLPGPTKLIALGLCAAGLALAGCGSEEPQLAEGHPNYEGEALFVEHCSGCHTLNVAGTQGSASSVKTREYKDGPNFDQRAESADDVLYAIQNGGFSSGPMPQNIVTGDDAKKIADYIAKYSGSEAGRPQKTPSQAPSGASQPEDTQ